MSDQYTRLGIADLVHKSEDRLRQLRSKTMGYTHVDSTGAVVVDTSNIEFQNLQSEITALEAKLARVSELAATADAELSGHGVNTIEGLHEKSRRCNDIIQSAPITALEALRRMREVAIFNKREGVATALPSELPGLLPEYAAEEARLKAALTQAQAERPALLASIDAIVAAAEEAKGLLR